jgi:hypothetical protein
VVVSPSRRPRAAGERAPSQAGMRMPWGTRRESWPSWTMLSIPASPPTGLWRAQNTTFREIWMADDAGLALRGWLGSIRCVAGFARVCLKQFPTQTAAAGRWAGIEHPSSWQKTADEDDGKARAVCSGRRINWSNLATSRGRRQRESLRKFQVCTAARDTWLRCHR